MIYKYCYFRAGENLNNSHQRNKLRVAKILHTGEAQVVPERLLCCVTSFEIYFKAVKIHPTSKGLATPTNLSTTETFEVRFT